MQVATVPKVILYLILLLILSYFSLFKQLGEAPMHLWDESSYALNAQEMLESGNIIEVSLFGKPDLYNSKPPLAIWCMAVGIQLFGFTEIGARVASASFALLAVVLLFFMGVKLFKNPLLALTMPLILLSSFGFVNEHIARTGDTDGILAFWILAQCIAFYKYTASDNPKEGNRYLLLTALFISLGCLTKGIAGLTALPGLFAWIVYSNKVKELFMSKYFYVGVVIFIVLVPGYYLLRNYLTPGYMAAVYNFEIGGRLWQQEFLNPEFRPFYFYYQSMFANERFVTWIFILPVAIIYIIKLPSSAIKSAGLFFVFALFGVSVSLALSSTKLFWYDAPMYPLMAVLIGIAASQWLSSFKQKTFVLFIVIWIGPYYKVVSNNNLTHSDNHFSLFLKALRNGSYKLDTFYVINEDASFPLHFYAKQDSLDGNRTIIVHSQDSLLRTGNLIITEKYAREFDINQKFVLDTLEKFKECSLYKIVAKK